MRRFAEAMLIACTAPPLSTSTTRKAVPSLLVLAAELSRKLPMSTWMNRRCGLATVIAVTALLTSGARADVATERQILGTWLTQDKNGVVQFYLTATGKLEGRIVGDSGETERLDGKNPDPALRGRPLSGAVIFRGFRYLGDGKWTDGTVYDPDSGKTYKCSMELKSADTLSIRGYIGVSLFGRSQLWTRKKE
jgi:uncharacterized protein (DUF2147 family)